jgi:dihydrodipicolinate synthase/N-acetylneuraminate lyase
MTGLLYLIVVVMWAVVLVPIWLKSHDRAQVEKVLREEGELAVKWRWQQREPMSPRQIAFVRRRRAAMILFTALVATIVLSAAGRISVFWIVAPTLLIAGFAAVAARNAKHAPRLSRKLQSEDETVPRTQAAIPDKRTEVIALTESVTETRRTWQPVETPLPSYVKADKATTYSRVIDSEKPWTGQDMVEQAELLKSQRAERIQESQKRLEEARAIAMEKARKAAIAAAQTYPEVAVKRAVNE